MSHRSTSVSQSAHSCTVSSARSADARHCFGRNSMIPPLQIVWNHDNIRSTTVVLARYPALYQINTRVWLTELSRVLRRPATLDDIPDADLDRLAERGFDWVGFLGVLQTGLAGQQVSRTNPEWRKEFQETLPDLREEDIAGSGFAI